jgi:hypothetical protein
MMTEASDGKSIQSIYFDADYTESVVVKATARTPEFSFTYKPLNVYQASLLTDQVIVAKKYEGVMLANLELIANHIIKCNLVKPNGALIDMNNVEELKKMSPKVIDLILKEIRKDNSTVKKDVELTEQALGN